MKAIEFGNKYGFTDNDKFVVEKMYKETEKTEEEWIEKLSPDFNERYFQNIEKKNKKSKETK